MSIRASDKAARFTESVIREMTRLANLHGAVNLSQGFPDFPAPEEVKEAAVGMAGSHEELISVYSIVNSLTVNFPAVKRVQILVDDRPVATLAGHVDLSRPLPPDMTLLAAEIGRAHV